MEQMVSLMSNDLVSCVHSPNKFWARLGLELKMSAKEVKVIVSDMFRGNDSATAPFKIRNMAEVGRRTSTSLNSGRQPSSLPMMTLLEV